MLRGVYPEREMIGILRFAQNDKRRAFPEQSEGLSMTRLLFQRHATNSTPTNPPAARSRWFSHQRQSACKSFARKESEFRLSRSKRGASSHPGSAQPQ